MKMVPNARRAWKWFSVQAMAAAAALPFAWAALPDDLRAAIPESWLPWITGALLIGGIAGRLIDQGSARSDEGPGA